MRRHNIYCFCDGLVFKPSNPKYFIHLSYVKTEYQCTFWICCFHSTRVFYPLPTLDGPISKVLSAFLKVSGGFAKRGTKAARRALFTQNGIFDEDCVSAKWSRGKRKIWLKGTRIKLPWNVVPEYYTFFPCIENSRHIVLVLQNASA